MCRGPALRARRAGPRTLDALQEGIDSSGPDPPARDPVVPLLRPFDCFHRGELATIHHSFLGSFSAVSKRNFATKYAFFQFFRDLQNYLADFFEIVANFAKNRKILQNFAKIFNFRIFAKKSADFCENR